MPIQHFFVRRLIILAGFIGLSFICLSAKAGDIWLDVNTGNYTLSVMKDNDVQIVFENISIGRFGTTYFKIRNDNKTPLGRFRVGWINDQSRYYRFFGLDYPNRETARRAFEESRITEETWESILRTTNVGNTPPQDTPLGGHIGIHGLGAGDHKIHHKYNWTNGCIALTNQQIDELSRWIKPGIMVEIR
ncbi:MAG: L,D-transpeptidase [Nitrosomonas sp.]|nr:L,D-transpeptidase [Nitrosomonas sp.]MDP1950201.1 L,D-transpeptidase [Nitrosomonas sp.]